MDMPATSQPPFRVGQSLIVHDTKFPPLVNTNTISLNPNLPIESIVLSNDNNSKEKIQYANVLKASFTNKKIPAGVEPIPMKKVS